MINWFLLHLWYGLQLFGTATLHAGQHNAPHHLLPQYKVNSLEGRGMNIRQPDHEAWQYCEELAPLHEPWDNRREGGTRFRAGYDKQRFYFRFIVTDSLPLVTDGKAEIAVAGGDRVELFFAADSTLREYYCLEMAPNGKVLDYHAAYYRKFNDKWDLEGLQVVTARHPQGYQVSGSIPLGFFRKLAGAGASLEGSSVLAGVFRADKNGIKETEGFKWYSWVMPRSATPDFHIPSAFGIFRF